MAASRLLLFAAASLALAPFARAQASSDGASDPGASASPAPADAAKAKQGAAAGTGSGSTAAPTAGSAAAPPSPGPVPPPSPSPSSTGPVELPGGASVGQSVESEAVHRDVQAEVRREMKKVKDRLQDAVGYVEAAEDARSYDAKELEELKQTVNLLQLHGYFRSRLNLFDQADLGRGPDASGRFLFPRSTGANGPSWVGAADMRLRLNPILRISDKIALYGQLDVLDNAIYGGNPLAEPYFDATTSAQLLSNRIKGEPISVKRLWAEIETPIGQLAFGRMGYHWGEGMLYNDGNCLDCDYGTTFDRLQFAVGPMLHHVVTLAIDSLYAGETTANSDFYSLYGNYGSALPLSPFDGAYRFSLAVTRMTPKDERREKLDDGEWVVDYGLLGAYRMEAFAGTEMAQVNAQGTTPTLAHGQTLANINGHLFEVDGFAEVLFRKLKLATEWAGIDGSFDHTLTPTGAGPTPLNLLQGAGVVRGQYALLSQNALLLGLDLGVASGDKAPGMGARPGEPGSGPGGAAGKGDIDGRQYGGNDTDVTNFRMNPDFRIDQLLWRNLFTTITDAWFARAEARYKPGGRASGGASDAGFELSGAAIYSQAIYAASTPSGKALPLGVELDASASYTSADGFFGGVIAGFLLPLDGLNNNSLPTANSPWGDGTAKLGQVYRLFLGTTF